MLLQGVIASSQQVSSGGYGDDFVIEVTTTTASELVTILCANRGTYNATVDWEGDGSSESTITAYNDADLAHTYSTAGVHELHISGQWGSFFFEGGGDCAKFGNILNWGDCSMSDDQDSAFEGCAMDTLPSDAGAIDFFNNILSDARYMFRDTDITAIPSGVTHATVDNAFGMYRSAPIISAPSLTFAVMSIGNTALSGATLPVQHYSDLLVAMEDANTETDVSFDAGSSQYDSAGETAKDALIARTPDGWSFIDGGLAS